MGAGTRHQAAAGGERRWAEIYDALVAADRRGPLDVHELERLAEAAFFLGHDDESATAWERAHHAWLELGDADRAARCAFWLGLGLLLRGEGAPASGWFGRGRRLIRDAPAECASAGYLLVPAAIAALEVGDDATATALYEQAGAIAERCRDQDLSALALLGRGEAAIARGETTAGLALLDEVMVAATTGEVAPITTGILYCAVIDACVKAFDLRRAAEWTEALTRWCDGQPDLVPYRGQCLVHRSQVLQAHGRWNDALAEANRAQERMRQPPHPAIGVAYYQTGELHRLRGDYAAAAEAYDRASEHGRPPTPGLALLRLAEGHRDTAAAAVRRMLQESRGPLDRLAVLPAFVEIMVAVGDVDAAQTAIDELSTMARDAQNPFVDAITDHALASVLLASGDASAALGAARRAQQRSRELGLPYEAARAQQIVAASCRSLGDADAAAMEQRAARAVFERLGARHDLAAAPETTVVRQPHDGTLTARERDVLRLVAEGKTNREVGAELHISEHTVARHVQNIFTKLGVSSRVSATAYAYEHGIV